MNYSTSRSPSPSSPATIRHRSLVRELQTGYNAAEQLRRRLIRSPEADDPSHGVSLSDVDLVELIFNSFNNSLEIARSSDDFSSALISPRFSSDACKIEDSGCGGGRRGGESSRIKDRRGCYKRRKRGQSWTTEGETPNEDGHAWRKYGQKIILHSKFPRNYYRCTHKTDQGCQAQKQVQKISEEPPRYKTSYSGEHTCKNPHKTPQIIIPSSSSPDGGSDSSILLSFERAASNPHHNNISPLFPPSIKEELPTNDQVMVMNMMMMINNHHQSTTTTTTSSDYNYLSSSSPDPAAVGAHLGAGSVDHGTADVISVGNYSCSPSPTSLENIDHFMMLGAQDHLDDFIEF